MTSQSVPSNVAELIYKEYVRLSERYESLLDSSFNDFKLLGAVGALIAWPPLASLDVFNAVYSGLILFIGFVGILIIVAIIGTRDVLKGSLVDYYIHQMIAYEDEIKRSLQKDTNLFDFAHGWRDSRRKKYLEIYVHLSLIFVIFLVAFPIFVLVQEDEIFYALIYGGCLLVVLPIYISATRRVSKL
jgi:hypothetical protein